MSLNGGRLAKLRASLQQQELDALLISQPENRAYLSGFSGSTGWLLLSAEAADIATDFRYYEQAEIECPEFRLVKIPFGGMLTDILPEMIRSQGVRRLGFEADHATFADVQAWSKSAPDCEWAPTKGVAMAQRAIKGREEIAVLAAAVKLADEALATALAHARPGMTEMELAWLIESDMRRRGASAAAFEIIVACGPNGARPHARASDAALTAGQPIVIDMGARLKGYNSDLTRTVCLGQPADPERFWAIYNTVLRAQQAVEAAIRPGMTGQQADAIARDVIGEAGYGEYFGHGLGHGVGLAVHEEPRLSRTNAAPLVAGHVVTVEPGIYLPGWGGVRIEDMAVLTENGVEVLTAAPKDPII